MINIPEGKEEDPLSVKLSGVPFEMSEQEIKDILSL